MTVSYIETENALTVVIAETGKIYNIDNTHANWDKVRENLYEENYEGLEELLSVKKVVENFFNSSTATGVEVDDIGVKFNGEYVHNYLTNKILDFAKRGLSVKPLVNFFEKVMKNPSYRAVNELYKFLEHGLMPITPNGNFLGYKSVKENYKDWYSGKFDNSIGQTLEMPRNQVCDDPELGCSYGFHVGTLEYAKNFNSGNRVMIVEVDPSDVVSVPHDCDHQKLRTAKYVVVGEFEKPLDNDYTDEYNKEEETDERTIEDVEREIDNVKDNLVRYSHCLTPSEIIALGEELEGLEEELEAFEDDDEEDDDTTTYGGSSAPHRDSKGRFCKRSN
jgi:hypothetical protein